MFIGVRPGSLEIVAGATASVNISIVDTDATPVAQPVRVAVLGPPDLQDNGFAIWDLR